MATQAEWRCVDCSSVLDRWFFVLCVYEDDLERIAREEEVEFYTVGFSRCVQCDALGREATIRALFTIDIEDWLEARHSGLPVVTIKRS